MGKPFPNSHIKFSAKSAKEYLSAMTKQTYLHLNHPARKIVVFGVLHEAVLGKVTKLHLKKKSTYFSTINVPSYAWWQNWIQFKMHLSELSVVSNAPLLFGFAARLFPRVFTKRRRCHLNMAKQSGVSHSVESDRRYSLEKDTQAARDCRLFGIETFWSCSTQIPSQSRSHCSRTPGWEQPLASSTRSPVNQLLLPALL